MHFKNFFVHSRAIGEFMKVLQELEGEKKIKVLQMPMGVKASAIPKELKHIADPIFSCEIVVYEVIGECGEEVYCKREVIDKLFDASGGFFALDEHGGTSMGFNFPKLLSDHMQWSLWNGGWQSQGGDWIKILDSFFTPSFTEKLIEGKEFNIDKGGSYLEFEKFATDFIDWFAKAIANLKIPEKMNFNIMCDLSDAYHSATATKDVKLLYQAIPGLAGFPLDQNPSTHDPSRYVAHVQEVLQIILSRFHQVCEEKAKMEKELEQMKEKDW